MATITRVTGAFSDGAPLAAEDLTKDTFQYGREHGFDGTKGGLEIINGQLDFDGNFSGTGPITAKHVRRQTFHQGAHVSGYRQSRDVWYQLFPDLNPVQTPNIYEQARTLMGRTWENQTLVDSVLLDINMDYTVASNEDLNDSSANTRNNPGTAPFRAFLGVWINGVFYEPSATPLVAGRASTVRPPLVDDEQYLNHGLYPDFRTFSMKIRVTVEDAAPGTPLAGFLAPGWRNVSVRVSGRQTIRVHGGAIIVIPMR